MKESEVSETKEIKSSEDDTPKESMKERYDRLSKSLSPEKEKEFNADMSMSKYNDWRFKEGNKGTRDDFRKEVMDRYENVEKQRPKEAVDIKEGEKIKIQSPDIETEKGISKGKPLEYEAAEVPKDLNLKLPENSIVYVKDFKDNRQQTWKDIQSEENISKNGFKDNEVYKAVTTQELTFYRTYGGPSKETGCFVSTERDTDPIEAKTHNAIPMKWNTHEKTEKVTVPAGTEIYVGKIGPKPTYFEGERTKVNGEKEKYPDSKEFLPGGNDQIILPANYTKFKNESGKEVLSEEETLVRKKTKE